MADYGSYLHAKGVADIFFPTDFWLLERLDHYSSGWLKLLEDKSSKQGKKRRTITLDTSAFMGEFGQPSKTRTKDGYNPLLDDFKNTKIYLCSYTQYEVLQFQGIVSSWICSSGPSVAVPRNGSSDRLNGSHPHL